MGVPAAPSIGWVVHPDSLLSNNLSSNKMKAAGGVCLGRPNCDTKREKHLQVPGLGTFWEDCLSGKQKVGLVVAQSTQGRTLRLVFHLPWSQPKTALLRSGAVGVPCEPK